MAAKPARPKRSDWNPPAKYRRWVAVKFRDLADRHLDWPYVDGVERFILEHQLGPWGGLRRDFPGIKLRRTFTAVDPERLATLVNKAQRLSGGMGFDDVLRHFRIRVPAGQDHDALADRLQAWDVVEIAYVESPPTPPPVDPDESATIDLDNLGHLLGNRAGIGALLVRDRSGGRGEGTHFADVEQGWDLDSTDAFVDHPDLDPGDLAPGRITLRSGVNNNSPRHGINVLGVIRALENSKHAQGVAPLARGILVSEYRNPGDTEANRGDAILAALDALPAGGVMLLELQIERTDRAPSAEFWPVELEDASLRMIQLATALGVTVIEAAGDGDDQVGTTTNLGRLDDTPQLDPTSTSFADSGAILVASATHRDPHRPLGFGVNIQTRYGTRVDCYAWGEKVGTTSVDAMGGEKYDGSFGDTSAASAIIAGTALVVQGMFQAAGGFPVMPARLRDILRDATLGTRSEDPPNDQIGVMPDLSLIANRWIPSTGPDVFLRDNTADTGAPHTGPASLSPDIIVRRSPVADPHAAFGAGSGTEMDADLSDSVASGRDHFLYVRLKNRGTTDSGPVNVHLYWARPSSLVTPESWTHIPLGVSGPSTIVPNVPAGGTLTVSSEVLWPASEIPASGHYCFVAVVDAVNDPAPHPVWLEDWDHFVRFIRDNNNVTWRNFNVVDIVMGTKTALSFSVCGAAKRKARMRLSALGRQLAGFAITLEMPGELAKLLGLGSPLDRKGRKGSFHLPIGVHDEQILGEAEFPAGYRAKCRLLVEPVNGKPPKPGVIAIRQSTDDLEVGRITWALKPRA